MAERKGARFRSYDSATVKAVSAVLANHVGPERAAVWDRLAGEAGVSSRRFRQVATDFDGSRWLLAKADREDGAEPNGIFLAETPGQAESLSAELRSKQSTLDARLGRRAYWCEQRRGARQLGLFERGAA